MKRFILVGILVGWVLPVVLVIHHNRRDDLLWGERLRACERDPARCGELTIQARNRCWARQDQEACQVMNELTRRRIP